MILAPLRFFAAADAFLETTLPALFFMRSDFCRPPEVFALAPRNTVLFARLPLAMTDFFMARFFMPFFIMDFMPFIAFMPFMADFIAAFIIIFIAMFVGC